MARKRKIPPNAEMLKRLEKRKRDEAEFERDMKALQEARETRWVEVGQLAEECRIAGLSDAELRAGFERIAREKEALPKAA